MRNTIYGDIDDLGIVVYVEDGIIHEATDSDDIEIGEDTEQNRADAIADA